MPLVNDSIVVQTFLSLILSYLSFLFLPCSPYHGKDPFRKYIRINPTDSKSSLRLCSIPKCAFTLAYLAVPVKDLLSQYGICSPVLGSLYLLANPKSITYTMFYFLPCPIRKLSGFISLCMKWLLCKNSNRYII